MLVRPFFVGLLSILVTSHTINLAVVRPFSSHDVDRLIDSFVLWERFHPCVEGRGHRYTLYLSYSKRFDTIAGERVEEKLQQFLSKRKRWMSCFDKIQLHQCRIPDNIDIYNPFMAGLDRNWVAGPNHQFTSLARFMSRQASFDAWYLMEADSVPRRGGFLTALSEEISNSRPFAILGSRYRGDRWDMVMNEIHPTLKNHINGNAVYNQSEPLMDRLLQQLEKDIHQHVPYDYMISQILLSNQSLYPIDYQYSDGRLALYKGESTVLGNYASTNMLSEFFGDEYIVHGAKMFDSWNVTKNPIGLVVSDWGKGHIHPFHQVVVKGYHPFSEVVYVVPYHTLPVDRDYLIKGQLQEIRIRYVTRNGPTTSPTPDYLDHCYYQPVTTNYFMTTNTYMSIGSPVNLLVDRASQKPVISYLADNSSSCQNLDWCLLSINDVTNYLNVTIDRMVSDMSMIYQTGLLGQIGGREGYCSVWFNYYQKHLKDHHQLIDCRPNPGPTATGYLAYLKSIGQMESNYYSNAVFYGAREVFVMSHQPLSDDQNCEAEIRGKPVTTTVSTSIAFSEKKRYFHTQSLITCTNILDDPHECNSIPFCTWRPNFNKCFENYEPEDSVEQEFIKSYRQDSEVNSYPSSRTQCRRDDSLNGLCITGIVFGAIGLLSLIPWVLFLGGIFFKMLFAWCASSETISGPGRHLATAVVPSLQPVDVVYDHIQEPPVPVSINHSVIDIAPGVSMPSFQQPLPPLPPLMPPPNSLSPF
jgi:hypothetical protein